MKHPTCELTEERPDAETRVVVVSGEIHATTIPDFGVRLAAMIPDGTGSSVVIDLAAVSFIDSTGLSILLDGLRRINRGNGRLALVVANPTVLRLFEITRLDTTFAILPTRDEALAHVRGAAQVED